jgi:hypothetical protein
LESGCALSGLLAGRLAAPAAEFALDPARVESFSAFKRSVEFASAVWNVIPDEVDAGGIVMVAIGDVVDEAAIRTPVIMHVACQHFVFRIRMPSPINL